MESVMSDTKNLWILGLILGAVTGAVMFVATIVVHAHIQGQLTLEGGDQVAMTAGPTVLR
jgi:hypothetical protein